MTSDGTKTYEWDAENRLVAVNQGTLRSEFTYDAYRRRVRSLEMDSGMPASHKFLLHCGLEICEERDAPGTIVTKRFFSNAVQDASLPFYQAFDHLDSVRELTDELGAVRARQDFDPFGRLTKLAADKEVDLGFAGHEVHLASGLTMAPWRSYDASLGRWLNEDPLSFGGGDSNLYRYVLNRPTALVDSTGGSAGVLAPVAVLGLAVLSIMAATAASQYIRQHPLPPLPPFLVPDIPLTPPPPEPSAPRPPSGTTADPVPVPPPPPPVPMAPPTPPPAPPTKPSIEVPSKPTPPPQKVPVEVGCTQVYNFCLAICDKKCNNVVTRLGCYTFCFFVLIGCRLNPH